MKQNRTVEINKWISLVVIVTLLLVVSLSAYVTKQTQDSMEFVAQRGVEDASKLVAQHLENYFDTVILYDQLAMNQWKPQENFLEQALQNEEIAQQLVRHYPYIQSLQYGDTYGNFAMYRKDVLGNINTKLVITDEEKPAADRYPRVIWRYFDQDTLVREVVVDGIDFDPRVRPWYTGAKEATKLYMTEPYEFFTDKVVGITAARKYTYEGTFIGVYSFDISLDLVVQYINELSLNAKGETFIVTPEKRVIGVIEDPISERTYSGFVNPLNAVEDDILTNSPLGKAVKVPYGTSGEVYYIVYQKILSSFEFPWSVGVKINRSSILSAYTWTGQLNLALSILLVLLTALLLYYRYRQTLIHEHLAVMAKRDQLTGLHNRHSFDEFALDLQKRYRENGETFSVILGDVDSFKQLNDYYGHKVGDSVLVALSEVIQASIRRSDYACRWGGEEFLVVLPGTQDTIACQVARSLLKRIVEKPLLSDAGDLEVTMSFGVATYDGEESMIQLINRADQKLYQAKTLGKNQVLC